MNIAYDEGPFPVAAIEANGARILQKARELGGLVFFPELALSGYPPQDLLFQAEFKDRIGAGLETLKQELPLGVIVGFGTPIYRDDKIYNALILMERGKILYEYHKQELPNFGVFDEKRYFTPGNQPGIFEVQGKKIGFLICEDLWHEGPLLKLKNKSLDQVVCINASPFEQGKALARKALIKRAEALVQAPILYVNHFGVEDELIFDGASAFHSDNAVEEIYRALCFALKGYVDHHKFPGVLIGLSGGIDSALVLAIAVDALGANRVQAVLMPSKYTAKMSIEDAESEAKALGVVYDIISIQGLFQNFLTEVSSHFVKQGWDLTEENIQARLRGMILMALSNKSGKMVVSTTNKSELAVGYGTLYGDLAGGFALLKDVYKTQVYDLVRYRNSIASIIPLRVITRAPSAELREDQTDQDSLPDYALLDEILKLFIEENKNPREIKKSLQHEAEIDRVLKLVKRNEYKRSQAPIGPKISKRAFGRDWRMPIMSV